MAARRFWDRFHSTRRVSPRGASFFPIDRKETKGSPGETHIAVGNKFPPAPVRSPTDPPVTGDTPIPFRKISGAQNTVPGLIPPGPPGPDAVQNSSLHHFAAAPGSDQPWQRVRVGARRTRLFQNPTGLTGKRPATGDGQPQSAAPTAFLTAPFGPVRRGVCGRIVFSARSDHQRPQGKGEGHYQDPHAGTGVQKQSVPACLPAAADPRSGGLGQKSLFRGLLCLAVLGF